jgi:hypothetical protein
MSLIVKVGGEWLAYRLARLALKTTSNLKLLMVRIGSADSFAYWGLQFHHIKLQLLMNYNISLVCASASNIIGFYTFNIIFVIDNLTLTLSF